MPGCRVSLRPGEWRLGLSWHSCSRDGFVRKPRVWRKAGRVPRLVSWCRPRAGRGGARTCSPQSPRGVKFLFDQGTPVPLRVRSWDLGGDVAGTGLRCAFEVFLHESQRILGRGLWSQAVEVLIFSDDDSTRPGWRQDKRCRLVLAHPSVLLVHIRGSIKLRETPIRRISASFTRAERRIGCMDAHKPRLLP